MVPLVVIDWVTDWLANWVRSPGAVLRDRLMFWAARPRPEAQLTAPAAGVDVDAPMAMVGEVLSPNRLEWARSIWPVGEKVTVPVAIWPLLRPEPVCRSVAGTARSSAYH